MQSNNPLLAYVGFRPTGDLDALTCYTSRRGRVVWFPKTPPGKAPSDAQIFCRNRFRLVGEAWQMFNPETRNAWNLAARRAGLYLHGYNLFLWWCLRRDPAPIRTLERNTGINLLPHS